MWIATDFRYTLRRRLHAPGDFIAEAQALAAACTGPTP